MQPSWLVRKLIQIWFNDSFQHTCSCAIFFHLENQHGIFCIFILLTPSPSSCSVIKFTLSPIYLEINLIPTEKRGWAFALYLPLRFIHLIPLRNSLCLCQLKNPPKLLKHVLPKMYFFKDKIQWCSRSFCVFPKTKETQPRRELTSPTVISSILYKMQVQSSWDVNAPSTLGIKWSSRSMVPKYKLYDDEI